MLRHRYRRDRDPFDEALEAAIAALPEPYRGELASVAIGVEEEPTAELLASVGARGLLGLDQACPGTRVEARDHER